MIIAVDGPAASGKGTLAKRLAAHFSLPHLDTGLLYRAVAHQALLRGIGYEDEAGLAAIARALNTPDLEADALRGASIGEAASKVAALPSVRSALLEWQRRFAAQPGGAVLDGRDIGTVIAPDAPVKIFVTASQEVRAQRRWRELAGKGEAIAFDNVLEDIRRRDSRDAQRASAPLRMAQDATLLDTTDLDIDGAFRAALLIVAERQGSAALDCRPRPASPGGK